MKVQTSTLPCWYVVYTCPKAEKTVCTKAQQLGFEAFLPLQKEVRQWSDRKKTVEAPIFPNYVFIRATPQHRFKLLKIRELVSFVSFEQTPATISDEEIASIKKISLSEVNVSPENFYQVGEKVVVIKGQFTGTEGILVRDNGKDKIVIQVRALRQAIAIELPKDCVVPVAQVARVA